MAEPDTQLAEGAVPNFMNDPQFATNAGGGGGGGEDGMGDADTCRICRGDGGDNEPLFHPCKCSGSIKFVHQDCLMEWLSHSQKKHCELCKTPFRFTKLYKPNMPQSLPYRVLLKHVVKHIAKNLWTWMRACLVVVVWLACLPYTIRQVWRLLFWFSDGGWPSTYSRMGATSNATAIQALDVARELQLATLPGNGTSPVTPFNPEPTTSASIGGIVEKLIGFLMPVSQSLNISGSDPLSAGLFKSLYYGLGLQSVVIPESQSDNATITLSLMKLSPPTSPSLLSEVSFLRNLTENVTVNDAIINIAEGYIITILVVVCFILVFLIREWVVQQQPGLNGGGFNAEPMIREAQPPRDRPRRDALDEAGQEDVNPIPQVPARERPIARPRRRNREPGERALQPPQNEIAQAIAGPSQAETGGPSSSGRPSPPRDALSPAAEIQRRLAEEPKHTEEFLAIWRRADSDPREVLRIIERENKVNDMQYWVNAMKGLPTPASQPTAQSLPDSDDGPVLATSLAATSERAINGGSSTSSESWVDVRQPSESQPSLPTENHPSRADPDAIIDDVVSGERKWKGKEKEIVEATSDDPVALQSRTNNSSRALLSENSWINPTFSPGPSRPRSVSDGPQIKENLSPLANNNWSFSNLSEDDVFSDQNISTQAKAGHESDFDSSDLVSLRSLLSPQEQNYLNSLISESPESSAPIKHASQSHPPQLTNAEVAELEQGPVTMDGAGRTYKTMEEAFSLNQLDTDSETIGIEAEEQNERPQANPFRPDTPLPDPRPLFQATHPMENDSESDAGGSNEATYVPSPELPAQFLQENELEQPLLEGAAEVEPPRPINVRPVAPQGFLGNVAEYLWGGVGDDREDEQGGDDEQIVQNIAAEAPFVPVAHLDANDQPEAPAPEQDREVVEAAFAAGIDPNDQDAIDDAEDFEGIMELVGMRGPIFSLVQNALFSAFLLALTVAFGIWIPYNIGRISLLLVANPGPAFKLPLRLIYGSAAFLQDLSLSILGMVSYALITLCSKIFGLFYDSTAAKDTGLGLSSAAMTLSLNSADRIMNGTVDSLVHITDSEIFAFSAASHESLIMIRSYIIDSVAALGASVRYLFGGDYNVTWEGCLSAAINGTNQTWNLLASLPGVLAKPDSWVISLEVSKRQTPLDLGLSVWDGWDRFWAIFGGYTALYLLGALYVKRGSPFSTGQQGREWETNIIEGLNQAGGVMKVILIISIEMLVFPLYCGLLLDAALLPLFDGATIMSRILFTCKSPFTSLFVHWFVGTCYMFHFALFVSMCRKIMRKGVLYFIRDPDDPTFHPVRDVLERNVATQLRKIIFSALVYGALVVVCLGGVVWGLAFAFKGVLPIHWSSNEPVLEFPIDLLFYNFLMPMAVRFFRPSDGLHSMYRWWFRQCARMLRLTWFMFDERRVDEEGYHVRRYWTDIFRGVKGDPEHALKVKDRYKPFEDDPGLKAYFQADGKYVRAPASDQVRVPKGARIFLEVDSLNRPVDGKAERHEKDSLYKQVYIPPFFRFRICLFILFIWLFAAATGVGITIVPLVFGRHVFGKIIPPHVRKNDVYAFSIGIYILGSALYAILNLRTFITYLRNSLAVNAETPQNVLRRISKVTLRVASIAWTYTAFLFISPPSSPSSLNYTSSSPSTPTSPSKNATSCTSSKAGPSASSM
ncbi:ERAD-associated E3 ubiquitin-protein ligase doa10 [Lachnellula suecica]|uniref:RING-type E3 ubiquitin transferase n=1 Tax=Lachnellula suecica TaxID=602035 RepID=A0A8T9C9E4_9HELO|nr:ERAD-associated E3 ubiquitin-protein ligase doa10 [Lachnellula suecica]